MANKAKEKNQKVIKTGKVKGTKEEKFDFNEEIVIGLKRIDEGIEKKKRKEAIHNEKKEKKKNKKQKQDEIIVKDIYSKQTEKNQNKKKKTKKPEKKLTPKQMLAKKKRKAILRLLKWTTLICLVIGGTIFFLLSPVFNINSITVKGNEKISSDEIISLSTLEIEQNMFQYHMNEVKEAIKQNTYIKTIELHRILPDKIEIIVEEREETYRIPIGNAYAYIDNQGYILEITSETKNLPIIQGITTAQENIQPGNRLDVEDLKKLNDVLKIMESANSNSILDLITTIDITDKEDYIIRMEEKKKTIHFGDTSNTSTKMLLIIEFNEEEKNTEGEIFLNMNLNDENNMPYFRKKI